MGVGGQWRLAEGGPGAGSPASAVLPSAREGRSRSQAARKIAAGGRPAAKLERDGSAETGQQRRRTADAGDGMSAVDDRATRVAEVMQVLTRRARRGCTERTSQQAGHTTEAASNTRHGRLHLA